MVGGNDESRVPPPPPPPPASGEGNPLAGDLERMVGGVEEAVAAYEAGDLTLGELQQRCLASGAVQSGGVMLIWDWVNGTLYGYDGFQLTELPAPS